MRTLLLALLIAAGCLSASGHVVHGAYQIEQIPGGDEVVGDFVVGPTKLDIALEPGTERVIELMVTNRMGERRQFNLSVEDTKGSENIRETVILLGDDRGPYSLKDYLKFPEASFELDQGERARIPVTVSVPADAQPGGLYGSVIVGTASLRKTGEDGSKGAQAGSVIVSRIASLFFVTVPGAIAKEGSLEEFKLLGNTKFYNKGPVSFQVLFRNTGSVHLNPFGEVTIKNMLGEEVGHIEADPWYAFPQSLRLRELTWDRPYLFGKYTATAEINRGYENIIDTKSVTFYVLPWTLLVMGFAGLLVIFFVLRFIARSFEIKRK